MNSFSKHDRIFDIVIAVIMGLIAFLFLIPLIHVLACSFSDANEVVSGSVGLFPVSFSLSGYQKVFGMSSLLNGFGISLLVTSSGTILGVGMEMLCAYPLSRKDFKGRKVVSVLLLITMFVSGGMIPTFLLISQLKMINTIWALIIPGVVSTFNVIVIKTYIDTSIPYELQEAARVDGCGDFGIFFRIIIPLSRPILIVVALFTIVGYWNNYFNALMYIQNSSLWPLQRVLQDLIVSTNGSLDSDPSASEQLKYVVIVVSSLPLLVIFPFFQKYFEKGVTIGGMKG